MTQLDLLTERQRGQRVLQKMDPTAQWSSEAAANHQAEIQVLVPLARELALKAGPTGINIDNILTAAVQRGLMPLIGKGRQHSFLGAVCRAAGLSTTGERRRSEIGAKHGNLRSQWRLP